MTKKAAKEIIEQFKEDTNYFNGVLNAQDMLEMFKYRYGFGEAESNVIVAALTIAGAKFN